MEKSAPTALCWQTFWAEKTGLLLNEGKEYGQAGRTFLRMNVAVSSARLNDGLGRLIRGVRLFCETQD